MRIRPAAIVPILLLASPAYALDPAAAITIEPPSDAVSAILHEPDTSQHIERTAVEVRTLDSGTSLVTISLTLAASAPTWTTAVLPIRLPRDATVVGMTFAIANETHTAESLVPAEASRQFDDATTLLVDPALLEWTGRDKAAEQLALRVYPVSTEQHPTVTLTIALPHVAQPHVVIAGQRAPAVRHVASAADAAAVHGARGVSEDRSLFVDPSPAGAPASQLAVRNAVRASREPLLACYADRRVDDVVLRFTIGTDGHAGAVSVEGARADIARCIGYVVASWQFRPSPSTVAVRYPLRLVTR
jgi:hypothetical protein